MPLHFLFNISYLLGKVFKVFMQSFKNCDEARRQLMFSEHQR
ncbi:hypothetical protein PAMC26577_32575 [Caballeronia sordidicola]|uniref:Uncharacterized protein n=1 Tax=Caballeronia sordidicola TaxID=196367 RepID=A0A242MBM0_CABSO|nr:hypothetical protein PAMC26577_32575 [Caballeronia sordidicola]